MTSLMNYQTLKMILLKGLMIKPAEVVVEEDGVIEAEEILEVAVVDKDEEASTTKTIEGTKEEEEDAVVVAMVIHNTPIIEVVKTTVDRKVKEI